MRSFTLAFLVSGLLGLAGCGGGGNGSATALDACGVLSGNADASALSDGATMPTTDRSDPTAGRGSVSSTRKVRPNVGCVMGSSSGSVRGARSGRANTQLDLRDVRSGAGRAY